MITLDGYLTYWFTFSFLNDRDENDVLSWEQIKSRVKEEFNTVVFDDEDNENPLLSDIKTGQDFLHGGGMPFACKRVVVKDYSFTFRDYKINNAMVHMNVYPETETAQICISMGFEDCLIEDVVYFRHLQGNGAKLTSPDGIQFSVMDIFNRCSGCLKRNVTDVGQSYLLEITRFADDDNIESIVSKNSKALYGMMTGDEGYVNVPENMAKSRLDNYWGSRDFIRFISFGDNSLFINLRKSQTSLDYTERRRSFDAKFYGDINPYFIMDSKVAGVNHGVIFAIELVLVIKTICNRILRKQAEYNYKKSANLREEIRKTKLYRGELLSTLKKVESLSISEIGEMEKIILQSHHIEPVIERIKYLLELLETELDLMYQTSTNRLVNILTVAGLIIAAAQLFL